MFAQSVDENIGGKATNLLSAPGEWGKVVLSFWGILIGLMIIFAIIAYFARRKFLSKEDRKAKFIRLP
jgi:hypothetical protein